MNVFGGEDSIALFSSKVKQSKLVEHTLHVLLWIYESILGDLADPKTLIMARAGLTETHCEFDFGFVDLHALHVFNGSTSYLTGNNSLTFGHQNVR